MELHSENFKRIWKFSKYAIEITMTMSFYWRNARCIKSHLHAKLNLCDARLSWGFESTRQHLALLWRSYFTKLPIFQAHFRNYLKFSQAQFIANFTFEGFRVSYINIAINFTMTFLIMLGEIILRGKCFFLRSNKDMIFSCNEQLKKWRCH